MLRRLPAVAVLVVLLAVPLSAPPAAADPTTTLNCIVSSVLAGIPDLDDLLVCGLTGSEGFIAMYSSGSPTGLLSPRTVLIGYAPGWECTSGGNPAELGDLLADASPSVSCDPPPGALPAACKRVDAWIGALGGSTGWLTSTASCDTLEAQAYWASPISLASGSTTGDRPFPFSCAVDNSASPDLAWLTICFVNLGF